MTGKKIMRMRHQPALAVLVLLLAGTAAAQNLKIVVHASNQVSSLSRPAVSDMFMKKKPKWESGIEVQPIDQKAASAVRAEFTKTVLNKTTGTVQAYWTSQIFSGRSLPPQEAAGDAAVLDWVHNNPGGIGYVSAGAALAGYDVKAIAITK
jgi:ABC-type phosphate transport system substrate-binding protein